MTATRRGPGQIEALGLGMIHPAMPTQRWDARQDGHGCDPGPREATLGKPCISSPPSGGLIPGAGAGAPEDGSSIWQGAAARCESGELPPFPPERSNLGSERSRERPETPGTPDCTASAAVSLACSSHRVRLLTSRAVTSHRRAPRRLPLGVTRGTGTAAPGPGGAAGWGAQPWHCQPSAQPPRHLQPRTAMCPGCGDTRWRWHPPCAGWQRAGEGTSGRTGTPPGHGSSPSPTPAAPGPGPLPGSGAAPRPGPQPPGSPETERRAPLLCRVSPLYLCLVIHL